MINAFALLKHPHHESFQLNLFLDSIEVASFHFYSLKEIQIDYFVDEDKHYLTTAKHSVAYVPLECNCSKALHDLLEDFPADFSRFEYARK